MLLDLYSFFFLRPLFTLGSSPRKSRFSPFFQHSLTARAVDGVSTVPRPSPNSVFPFVSIPSFFANVSYTP